MLGLVLHYILNSEIADSLFMDLFLKACAWRNVDLLCFVVCISGGGLQIQTEPFGGTAAVLFDLLLLGINQICPFSLCLPTAETCSKSLYSCQNT